MTSEHYSASPPLPGVFVENETRNGQYEFFSVHSLDDVSLNLSICAEYRHRAR